MDASYTFFRQLMRHWQQSVEARERGRDRHAPRIGAEQKLIAQFEQSWPDACLVFEED